MSRRLLISSALAGLLLGPVACQASQSPSAAQTPAGMAPVRGSATASVVLLVFSDLSCTTCAGLEPALKAIRDEFPKDVQIVFKHNPAPDDAKARLAHEAAVEAGRQGKFWEMHDLIAANPAKLEADDLAGYAKTLGLDGAAFAEALRARTHRAVVERDVLEAKALGATGTLALFINGRRGNGVPPGPVLSNLIRNLLAGGDGSGPAPVTAGTLDLSGSPIRGAADAPVTLVEFSDFQCGFCFRVNPTLMQVLDRYQGKVRVRLQAQPHRGTHGGAAGAPRRPSPRSSRASSGRCTTASSPTSARWSGRRCSPTRPRSASTSPGSPPILDSPRAQAVLDRDQAEAAKAGVDGTPTFFVNGAPLVGAQPLEAFTAAIDKALAATSAR